MQAIGRCLPAVLVAVALLTPSGGFSQSVRDSETVIESFLTPDAHAKPVNGTEVPAYNASDRVDVGTLLTAGQNTLTIRLHSTLYGRTYFEHSGYRDKGAVFGMGDGVLDPPVPGTYFNGLSGVSIIPYRATVPDDYDAIEDGPAINSQPASSYPAVYNLQGQRLSTPQRGVNIIGERSIIVK